MCDRHYTCIRGNSFVLFHYNSIFLHFVVVKEPRRKPIIQHTNEFIQIEFVFICENLVTVYFVVLFFMRWRHTRNMPHQYGCLIFLNYCIIVVDSFLESERFNMRWVHKYNKESSYYQLWLCVLSLFYFKDADTDSYTTPFDKLYIA